MAILKSCCCWRSVRSGSFASGIYTLTFYCVVTTAGSFHVHSLLSIPVFFPILLTFSLMMLAFSALSVLTSIFLLIGLCLDNRLLLLPWIIAISMTTVLDVILSLYLIADATVDPFLGVLFVTDFFICGLNIYCVLCVVSQYQEYMCGRGRPGQVMVDEILPAIHFEPASCPEMNGGHSPKVTISVIQNGASGSSCRLLAPCSTTTTSALLSRSSISSDVSFSMEQPSSRRGSLLQRERSDSANSRSALVAGNRSPRRGLHLVADVASVCPEEHSDVIVIEENDRFISQLAPSTVISHFRNSSHWSITRRQEATKGSPKLSPSTAIDLQASSDSDTPPPSSQERSSSTACYS